MQACIDEKQLLELAYGTATPQVRRAAEEHAETCDRCRELLDSASERITWTGEEPRTSEPSSAPLPTPKVPTPKETLPALPAKPPKKTASKLPSAAGGKLDPKALVDALRTAGFPVRPSRGTTIGRYLIIDKLAERPSDTMYSAYDPDEDRKVALRVYNEPVKKKSGSTDDPKIVRELRKIGRISHPHVATLWEVGIERDQIFVVTQFIKGETLSAWLGASRAAADVVRMFVQAGRGLAAAHAAGFAHGHFGPNEVFVGKDGVARIADVGIAAVMESAEASAGSDQVRFCQALEKALDGLDRQSVPDKVWRAIRRGASERAEDRFASMAELLTELEERPRMPIGYVVAAIALMLLGVVLALLADRFLLRG